MPDFSDNLRPAEPDGATTLSNERQASDLPVEELSLHLLGHDFLERQNRILDIMKHEPIFNKRKQLNLSRPERYHLGLARAKQLRRLSQKHTWNTEDDTMAEYLCDDVSPYMLHLGMFATTVREQGSQAQRSHWMPLINEWKIIGCYAQTELGHGSNVRGLELTATWDPKTKAFVLHSPTLTASKWWNGSMGRTANHAIIVAQLLLSDPNDQTKLVSHGPHSFIAQIRDMQTHKPLDGIIVGDIGPKYGYASMDNGYMLFRNFHIPHSALLARYSQLDPATGIYTKPENAALVYGSLTAIRAAIVMHARLVLARAVTVTTRYTAVRKQFPARDSAANSAQEMSVLDYPTVQIRVLPLLATAFALHYTGQHIQNLYTSSRATIETGDLAPLADLHATSSGLKSLCTELTANGIETCRRACGGHGFGGGSGLIQLNADYLSKPTVEGDNWMITQQTSRYIIKKMAEAVGSIEQQSREEESVARGGEFVHRCRAWLTHRAGFLPLRIFESDEAIVEAFERRAINLTYKAYNAQIFPKRAYNTLLIQFHKLSHAHSQALLIKTFHTALTSTNKPLSPRLNETLSLLFRLFAYSTIETHALDFSTAGAVSVPDLEALPQEILHLMSKIRPHAVALVDSWAIPDFLLDSALGRYDGKVYEDLFLRAHRDNPLNEITFNPDWRCEEIVKGSGVAAEKVLSKL